MFPNCLSCGLVGSLLKFPFFVGQIQKFLPNIKKRVRKRRSNKWVFYWYWYILNNHTLLPCKNITCLFNSQLVCFQRCLVINVNKVSYLMLKLKTNNWWSAGHWENWSVTDCFLLEPFLGIDRHNFGLLTWITYKPSFSTGFNRSRNTYSQVIIVTHDFQ